MTTIMRLYIPLSSNQGPRQFSPRFFCKARARDVSVTHAKLLWFDKTRGRAHESDGHSARTILLLPTNMSTSGLKSTKMSLYDCIGHGQDLYPQFSSEGLPWSGLQDRHETASVCSRHTRLLRTRVSVSACDEIGSKRRLNTIVPIPIEQDNFAQKYLSCLVVPV